MGAPALFYIPQNFGHTLARINLVEYQGSCSINSINDLRGDTKMENRLTGSNTLFVLLGAIMVLAMHSGFAFLEVGTVRHKNQVNALVKILCDFCISTIAYLFVGY